MRGLNQRVIGSIRWVFANDGPKRTHLDKKRSIHTKQVDCSDTNVFQSDNHSTVHRPIEVIKPVVTLRVEQSRLGSLISESSDSIGLVSIASRAGKPEVFKFCLAAKRQRIDVFGFKGDSDMLQKPEIRGVYIFFRFSKNRPLSSPDRYFAFGSLPPCVTNSSRLR